MHGHRHRATGRTMRPLTHHRGAAWPRAGQRTGRAWKRRPCSSGGRSMAVVGESGWRQLADRSVHSSPPCGRDPSNCHRTLPPLPTCRSACGQSAAGRRRRPGAGSTAPPAAPPARGAPPQSARPPRRPSRGRPAAIAVGCSVWVWRRSSCVRTSFFMDVDADSGRLAGPTPPGGTWCGRLRR